MQQCECPGCTSCNVVCDATCEGKDDDGICGCSCVNDGRINTEYGYLCATCYDFYDSNGYFEDSPGSTSGDPSDWTNDEDNF